jgi:hypothetical protein
MKKIWNDIYRSICSVSYQTTEGIRLSSFTAFKSGKYLFTDANAAKNKRIPDNVQIRFYEEDGFSINQQLDLTFDEFEERLLAGNRESSSAFAVYNFDMLDMDKIPSLSFSQTNNYQIGSPVALIGYQKEYENLTLKAGSLSAFYKSKGLPYFQYEMNMNQGQAGCPIIDLATNRVIGIGGVRASQMEEEYKKLILLIKNNLSTLEEARGKVVFGDIDPMQVLVANQNQIKYLAKELYKRASQSFGVAIDCQHVNLVMKQLVPLKANSLINNFKM